VGVAGLPWVWSAIVSCVPQLHSFSSPVRSCSTVAQEDPELMRRAKIGRWSARDEISLTLGPIVGKATGSTPSITEQTESLALPISSIWSRRHLVAPI
jgi:hypothetical protein